MLLEILTVIAPVMIITAIGYAMERRGVPVHSQTLSSMVLLVGTPSLIFSTLTALDVPKGTIAGVALAAVLVVGMGAGLAALALTVLRRPVRTFMPSLIMPNSGNLGLPLALLAFGEEGLAVAISFFFVVALLQYTVGAAIASGRYRFGQLAREPLIYAIIAVFVFRFTGWEVPEIVAETTRLLGGMVIPVMVILLGASLARLNITDLRLAVGLALVRLAIGIICGLAITFVLGFEGVEAGTVFLMAAMPAAIVTYVFASRYRPDSEQVAGVVVVSTVATFLVLPGIIWLALQIRTGALW